MLDVRFHHQISIVYPLDKESPCGLQSVRSLRDRKGALCTCPFEPLVCLHSYRLRVNVSHSHA